MIVYLTVLLVCTVQCEVPPIWELWEDHFHSGAHTATFILGWDNLAVQDMYGYFGIRFNVGGIFYYNLNWFSKVP